MKIRKARQPKKPRSIECLTAILNCKAAKMRHRADRRAKERQSAWKVENWE